MAKEYLYDSDSEDYCYRFEVPVYLKVSNIMEKMIEIFQNTNLENVDLLTKELKKYNIDISFVPDFKQFISEKNDKSNIQGIFDEYVTFYYKNPTGFDKEFGGIYNFSEIEYENDVEDFIEESFDNEKFAEFFDYFNINSIKIVDFKDKSFVIEICVDFELDDEQIDEAKLFIEEQCNGEWGKNLLKTEVRGCKIHVWWEKGEIKRKYNINYLGMTGPSESEDDDDSYYDDYDDDRY